MTMNKIENSMWSFNRVISLYQCELKQILYAISSTINTFPTPIRLTRWTFASKPIWVENENLLSRESLYFLCHFLARRKKWSIVPF